MFNDFLLRINMFEDTIHFTKPAKNKTRGIFTLVLILAFVTYTIYMMGKDFYNRSVVSLIRLSTPLENSQFSHDILKNINVNLYTNKYIEDCKFEMTYQTIFENEEKNISFSPAAHAEDSRETGQNHLYRHYPESKFGFEVSNPSESTIKNTTIESLIESSIIMNCTNTKNYIKAEFEKLFEDLEVNITLTYDTELNILSKDKPFHKPEIPNIYRVKLLKRKNNNILNEMFNSHIDICLKKYSLIDDSEYFSLDIFSITEENMDLWRLESALKSRVDFVPERVTVLKYLAPPKLIGIHKIGSFSYSYNNNEDIIIRKFPKINDFLPIYITIFFLIFVCVKMLFLFYDNNSKYLEYINSFYSLSIDDSIDQDDGYKSYKTFPAKLEESSKELDKPLYSKGINSKPISIVNSFVANSKINKGKKIIDATFVRSSFATNNNRDDEFKFRMSDKSELRDTEKLVYEPRKTTVRKLSYEYF